MIKTLCMLIRERANNPAPEQKLFIGIIQQAIKDGDIDYIKTPQFREHAKLAGLDHEFLLNLLREHWIKVCDTSQEPPQAASEQYAHNNN